MGAPGVHATSAGSTSCVTTLTLQSSSPKSAAAHWWPIFLSLMAQSTEMYQGLREGQRNSSRYVTQLLCLIVWQQFLNFISLDFNFCTRHRVLNPPGGGSSISFGGPSLPASQPKPKQEAPPPAPPPSKQQPVAPAAPSTRRPSSKVTAPPGGHSQITFG